MEAAFGASMSFGMLQSAGAGSPIRLASIYVELVLSGGLPTTPTASVEPLQLRAGVGWQARAMGTTSASRAQTFVPEAVLEYVDRFVADYRVANSR